MGIELESYSDTTAFSATVSSWLEEREAENALFLAILAGLTWAPPASIPFMVRVTRGGETVFAAIYHEFNLILSHGPDAAIDAVVAKLGSLAVDFPGVLGPAREAERFALAWAEEQACTAFLAVDQRIYQLTQVRRPAQIPGEMRVILDSDLEVVAAWAYDFDVEALRHKERRTRDEARRKIAARLSEGNLFGWESAGELVCMAGLARPTAKTISVNSVYTPPARRRQGFATALVAAVSEEGLQRGKDACVLYTDLTNPTSNSIYQKIGYRPVCDSRNYRFNSL